MNATVSCIIPTIGRSSLRRSVESVNAQKFPTDAIVVLDRPDRREQVVEILKGTRYTLVLTSGAAGGNVARNFGCESTNTEFVAFLDDDDWWSEDRIARQMNAIAAVPDSKNYVCTTSFWFHRGMNVSVVPSEPFDGTTDPATYVALRRDLRFGRNALQTSTVLVSRKLHLKYLWSDDLRKHQDWDYLARIIRDSDAKYLHVEEPLVHVVQDSPGSISKTSSWKASVSWLGRHREYMDSRAVADFVAMHILRAALSQRSGSGVKQAAKMFRISGRPHIAALVVGLSGIRR